MVIHEMKMRGRSKKMYNKKKKREDPPQITPGKPFIGNYKIILIK